MRESSSFSQKQQGTKVTLLLPQEPGSPVFYPPSKGACCDFFTQSLNFSTTPFISLIRKCIPNSSCTQNNLFSQFSSEPESCTCSSSSDMVPRPIHVSPLPSSHDFPLFLSFYNNISWVHFPIHGSDQEVSRWGTLPISSLILEEDFPTTNLTGN
jgi:hypothetical protein